MTDEWPEEKLSLFCNMGEGHVLIDRGRFTDACRLESLTPLVLRCMICGTTHHPVLENPVGPAGDPFPPGHPIERWLGPPQPTLFDVIAALDAKLDRISECLCAILCTRLPPEGMSDPKWGMMNQTQWGLYWLHYLKHGPPKEAK